MPEILHIGIDSICILRERLGFELYGSVKKTQARTAMPTATIIDMIGRLSVCLTAVTKLMRGVVYVIYYCYEGAAGRARDASDVMTPCQSFLTRI